MDKKLVCGVGINDADYPVATKVLVTGGWVQDKICPYYERWKSMLRRCYGYPSLSRNPTYKGCTVCDEWLLFSNFKAWMQKQDWKEKELDKDVLSGVSKTYSPNTCCFISKQLNSFLSGTVSKLGKYMTGVSPYRDTGRFLAKCSDPFLNKNIHLGIYSNELEAHSAWRSYRSAIAIKLSELEADSRVKSKLKDMFYGD